jgi:hypothetical protein
MQSPQDSGAVNVADGQKGGKQQILCAKCFVELAVYHDFAKKVRWIAKGFKCLVTCFGVENFSFSAGK